MKKIQVKVQGEWREVLLSLADWDGVGLAAPIVMVSAVQDIRLVDDECNNPDCSRNDCYYEDDFLGKKFPPQIEELSTISNDFDKDKIMQFRDKINLIIRHINKIK